MASIFRQIDRPIDSFHFLTRGAAGAVSPSFPFLPISVALNLSDYIHPTSSHPLLSLPLRPDMALL